MINMPIGRNRKIHILDIYRQMQVNGVGSGNIVLLHKVLNTMFNYAESEDMVRHNYSKGCTKKMEIYNTKREKLMQSEINLIL